MAYYFTLIGSNYINYISTKEIEKERARVKTFFDLDIGER